MKRLGLAALVSLLLAGAGWTQTATLVIGIEDYDRIADVRRGDEVDRLNGFMRAAARGTGGTNAEDVQDAVADYEDAARDATRQVIVLSGRFVHSASETYFLPADARPGSLFETSRTALPLSTVLALLAATPGDAVLALATDDTEGAFGAHLDYGIGALDLPQGVTLLRGDPRSMTRALTTLMQEPGTRVANVADRTGLAVSGFIRADQVLRDVAAVQEPEPAAAPEPDGDRLADLLAWRQADQTDTVEAYEEYLSAHPNGQFARMAENRLQALTDTPEAQAERGEQSLDLNRDQRREIQRDLSLLDYNTRGIDGIFGRGTRAAIGAWQGDNGYTSTGFLTEEQIRQLDAQAERRSAQLEAEAAARREEQLARDRAFWEETGAFGDEPGFRAYLERFPDGEFSEVARARLEEIEREKRRQTDARDRQLWDEARMEDSVQGYRDYLTVAPDGMFRDEAEARIAELERGSSNEVEQARREEQALNLSASTRRLIEARLERIGLDPGPVDGTFDDDTRRAIRRYQEARELPQTGYLSEAVVVRLLADSVRSLFR